LKRRGFDPDYPRMTNTNPTQAHPISGRHGTAAQRLGARTNLVCPALALSMAMLGAGGCGVELDAAEDDLQTFRGLALLDEPASD
jgi:hypothetical protein